MLTESNVSGATGTSWINRERRVLIIIVCAHFTLLLAMGLFRHWGYMSSMNDLGVYDQAVWGTLHGQWYLDSNNIFGHPINWLGQHFNLFLPLFVPLYAIYPAPEWFIAAQVVALSVAAWPIFLLASRVHGSERTGVIWAVIYLFNPFLLSAAAWDFHPVAIAVPFIAGALLSVEKKDFRLLMLCCLWLLLVQEQFGIMVAGFGGLWWLKHRYWRGGLFLVAAGLLHTVLVLGFIMPALSPTGVHPMIVSAHDSRYGWLGGSLAEIVSNIVLHPIRMLQRVVLVHGAIRYFVFLALPLLGLFFAAPLWLLPAIADLAANTLSANQMPRAIISYHSVTLVPILTVSAIYGTRRIASLFSKALSVRVTKWVLLSTAVFAYELAPLPLPGAINFWKPVHWVQTPDPVLKKVCALTAGRASLSVQANVGAYFTQHQRIFRYPFKVGEADIIVLRLESPTNNIIPHNWQGIGTVAHHLQMNPAEYLVSVERLLNGTDYGVFLWEEPWLVLARGVKNTCADGGIRKRLDMLRHAWDIQPNEYETALHMSKYQ